LLDFRPLAGNQVELWFNAGVVQRPDGLGLKRVHVVKRPLPKTEKNSPVRTVLIDLICILLPAQPPKSVTQVKVELSLFGDTRFPRFDAPVQEVDGSLQSFH